MRKKIVFGMAIISLVAIIVLCQKAGVRLKETFRESEETNSGITQAGASAVAQIIAQRKGVAHAQRRTAGEEDLLVGDFETLV